MLYSISNQKINVKLKDQENNLKVINGSVFGRAKLLDTIVNKNNDVFLCSIWCK